MQDPIRSDKNSEPKFGEAMQQYWLTNRGRFIDRVMSLENVAGSILGGVIDDALIDDAKRDAHRLKGSLGTFGLHRASELASSIEELLSNEITSSERLVDMSNLVVELRREVESHRHEIPITNHDQQQYGSSQEFGRTVEIITEDQPFYLDLSARLAGYLAMTYRKDTVEYGLDSDLILDLGSRNIDIEPAQVRLDDLQRSHARKIVIGSGLSIKHHVAFAKSGVVRTIDRDHTADEIANEIIESLTPIDPKIGVVLAVDDDLSMLDALNALISPHIKQFHSVSNPTQVWDAIEKTVPDVMIIDYEMPEIDGLDLLRVIRSERKYDNIPIVILSANNEPDIIQRMYAAGADAYLTKPLTGQTFAARVLSRIKRQASQRATADLRSPVPATRRSSAEKHGPTEQDQLGRLVDVVIVDDDEIVAGLLVEALNRQGYSVEWLKDGEQAVNLLCGLVAQIHPKLVLLDVDMPGINGLDVLRRLASDGVLSQIEVVMLTGRSTESETLEALRIGATDHVSKPFSLPVLMEKVRRAVGTHDAR